MTAPTLPSDLESIGYAATEAAARIAEKGADAISAGFAAMTVIAEATGSSHARRAVVELQPFVDLLLALEIAPAGTIAVPAAILEILEPVREQLKSTGVDIPSEVHSPTPALGVPDYAAGIRLGLQRASLLEQSKRRARGGLRR
jgi:hypothetical protein